MADRNVVPEHPMLEIDGMTGASGGDVFLPCHHFGSDFRDGKHTGLDWSNPNNRQ